MKKVIEINFIIFALLFSPACENILEENPPGSISISSFYQTENDAIVGLYGAYRGLVDLHHEHLLYSEMNADDMKVSPLVSDDFAWDEFTYNSDVTARLWNFAFSGINRANEVIFYTERIQFNEDRKADLIAEAKALRAFYYFQLVRALGGVPLYEAPTIGFDHIFAPKATENQVYDLIIRDLTDAAVELEAISPAGRFNSDIADALLARIYLYRGDYNNSLTHARNVINSGRYELFPDYADIFKPENNNGIEHIFQLQFMSGEVDNPYPGRFGPRGPAGTYANSFWTTTIPGKYAPSDLFVSDNPDSYRKDLTIADKYEHIDGSGTVTMNEVYGGNFPYYINKFDDRPAENQSGLNFSYIRYADVLLIAAETLNEVDPSDDQKYTWINTVRARARNNNASDLPDFSGLSQEAFRQAVLEERRFELAFEGQRAWDLKRRGKFIEVLSTQGKNVENYMLYFPIPDVQVRLNENLVQNSGWD